MKTMQYITFFRNICLPFVNINLDIYVIIWSELINTRKC